MGHSQRLSSSSNNNSREENRWEREAPTMILCHCHRYTDVVSFRLLLLLSFNTNRHTVDITPNRFVNFWKKNDVDELWIFGVVITIAQFIGPRKHQQNSSIFMVVAIRRHRHIYVSNLTIMCQMNVECETENKKNLAMETWSCEAGKLVRVEKDEKPLFRSRRHGEQRNENDCALCNGMPSK